VNAVCVVASEVGGLEQAEAQARIQKRAAEIEPLHTLVTVRSVGRDGLSGRVLSEAKPASASEILPSGPGRSATDCAPPPKSVTSLDVFTTMVCALATSAKKSTNSVVPSVLIQKFASFVQGPVRG